MGVPHYSDNGCTGTPPLVLGAARGRRSFYLDEGGWLRGVTYRAPWRDGVNEAECFVTKVVAPVSVGTAAKASHVFGGGPPYHMGGVVFDADPEVPPEPQPGYAWDRCDGLASDCACGFYAYHNSDVEYSMSGPGCRVKGVVEAYGRVVLGTKGFRAQKARVLAVCVPPQSEATHRRHHLEQGLHELEEAMEDLQGERHTAWRNPAVYGYLAGAVAAFATGCLVPGKGVAAMLLAGYAFANAGLTWRARKYEREITLKAMRQEQAVLASTLAALPNDYSEYVERARANYPGVQFFERVVDMAAAFPIINLEPLALEQRREAVDE